MPIRKVFPVPSQIQFHSKCNGVMQGPVSSVAEKAEIKSAQPVHGNLANRHTHKVISRCYLHCSPSSDVKQAINRNETKDSTQFYPRPQIFYPGNMISFNSFWVINWKDIQTKRFQEVWPWVLTFQTQNHNPQGIATNKTAPSEANTTTFLGNMTMILSHIVARRLNRYMHGQKKLKHRKVKWFNNNIYMYNWNEWLLTMDCTA